MTLDKTVQTLPIRGDVLREVLGLGAKDWGDFVLGIEIADGADVLRRWGVVVGLYGGLDGALSKLAEDAEIRRPGRWSGGAAELYRATLDYQTTRLQRLRKSSPLETDRLTAALVNGLVTLAAEKGTDHGDSSLLETSSPVKFVARLLERAPAGAITLATQQGPGTPGLARIGGAVGGYGRGGVPHIVALHGAGGSENMFHDAYGLGRLAFECSRRGWVLVALKLHSPADDLWNRLEALGLAASDGPPLVLLGHSMGSLAAIEMARQRPERIAGVVAISVGSGEDVSMLRGLPVLVAAGAEDFGRGSSRRLFERLKRAGARAEWLQTSSEHLMVVADSLPRAVDWIGQTLQSSAKRD